MYERQGFTFRGPLRRFGVTSLTSAATSGSDCWRMRNSQSYVVVNRTQRCSLLCHESAAFTASERKFAEVWMAIWSVPGFVSTLFTIVSFLIDPSRYNIVLSMIF